jgi:hypothetical protein
MIRRLLTISTRYMMTFGWDEDPDDEHLCFVSWYDGDGNNVSECTVPILFLRRPSYADVGASTIGPS